MRAISSILFCLVTLSVFQRSVASRVINEPFHGRSLSAVTCLKEFDSCVPKSKTSPCCNGLGCNLLIGTNNYACLANVAKDPTQPRDVFIMHHDPCDNAPTVSWKAPKFSSKPITSYEVNCLDLSTNPYTKATVTKDCTGADKAFCKKYPAVMTTDVGDFSFLATQTKLLSCEVEAFINATSGSGATIGQAIHLASGNMCLPSENSAPSVFHNLEQTLTVEFTNDCDTFRNNNETALLQNLCDAQKAWFNTNHPTYSVICAGVATCTDLLPQRRRLQAAADIDATTYLTIEVPAEAEAAQSFENSVVDQFYSAENNNEVYNNTELAPFAPEPASAPASEPAGNVGFQIIPGKIYQKKITWGYIPSILEILKYNVNCTKGSTKTHTLVVDGVPPVDTAAMNFTGRWAILGLGGDNNPALQEGASYACDVSAVNDAGEGIPISGMLQMEAAPTAATALGGMINGTTYNATWTAAGCGTPNTGCTSVVKCVARNDACTDTAVAQSDTIDPDSLAATSITLDADKDYSCYVVTSNSVFNGANSVCSSRLDVSTKAHLSITPIAGACLTANPTLEVTIIDTDTENDVVCQVSDTNGIVSKKTGTYQSGSASLSLGTLDASFGKGTVMCHASLFRDGVEEINPMAFLALPTIPEFTVNLDTIPRGAALNNFDPKKHTAFILDESATYPIVNIAAPTPIADGTSTTAFRLQHGAGKSSLGLELQAGESCPSYTGINPWSTVACGGADQPACFDTTKYAWGKLGDFKSLKFSYYIPGTAVPTSGTNPLNLAVRMKVTNKDTPQNAGDWHGLVWEPTNAGSACGGGSSLTSGCYTRDTWQTITLSYDDSKSTFWEAVMWYKGFYSSCSFNGANSYITIKDWASGTLPTGLPASTYRCRVSDTYPGALPVKFNADTKVLGIEISLGSSPVAQGPIYVKDVSIEFASGTRKLQLKGV